MGHGGHREGSGRKSSWASGCSFENTKLIRVPAAIADKVLLAAHKIDAGENILDSPSRRENYKIDDLVVRAKAIIYDSNVVRIKDRSQVKKYFSLLLDIDKETFRNVGLKNSSKLN